MRIFLLVVVAGIILSGLWWFAHTAEAPVLEEEIITEEVLDPVILNHIAEKADLIVLETPTPNQTIASPLTLKGKARGYWFFEASFPIVLTNWDDLIIAEGYATANGEWMTEEFVPFTATLNFVNPYALNDPDFVERGSLILKKDNPSGMPEYDDALEIPITFAPDALSTIKNEPILSIGKKISVYDGIEVNENAKELNLAGQQLSGSPKAEVRLLTKLEELDISDNNFTGVPAEVGQLTNLRILNLSNNPLTGLPYEIGNLNNLEVLDVRGTNYSAADLQVIQQNLPNQTVVLVD